MYNASDLKIDLMLLCHARQPFPRVAAVDADDIIKAVCLALSVKPKDVKSPSRKEELAEARHIICLVLRQHTALSFRQIGIQLGGRDHSTILSSVKTCQELLDSVDAKIVKKIALVNAHLPADLCI